MQLAFLEPSLLPPQGRKRSSGPHSAECLRSSRALRAMKYADKTLGARSRTTGAQHKDVKQQQQKPNEAEQTTAVVDYLPLVSVSLLWGSYTPALRFLYSMDSTLTPQVLTAHRTVISAAALLSASAISITYNKIKQHQQQQKQQQQHMERDKQEHQQDVAAVVRDKLYQVLPDWLQPSSGSNSSSSNGDTPADDCSSNSDSSTAAAAAVLAAGLELGIWNFLGTSSQAIGLELSTATKAAFLTQTTAIFTPCLAVLCGQVVAPVYWLACIAALLGSCCITLDSLIDVTAYVNAAKPSGQAAAPAVMTSYTSAVADRTTNSSCSSSQLKMAAAPNLRDDMQQTPPPTAAAAAAVSATSNSLQSFDGEGAVVDANSNTPKSVDGSSSSSSSDTAGLAVPAVTCSPTATPPQGVVPAISCAPVTNSTAAASSSAAATGSAMTAGNAAVQRQQQQQPASIEPVQLSSSSSMDAQQRTPKQESQQQQQQQTQHGDMDAGAAADDQADGSSSSSSSRVSGELYILLACCCYAIATVRLSMVARGLDPVHLATSKTLALAAASMCWLLAFQSGSIVNSSAAAAVTDTTAAAALDETAAAVGWSVKSSVTAALESAADAWQLPATYKQGQGLVLLVYSALGPGALAAVMQVKGQSSVSAAQAQVFYSLTPVWAALMAMLFLQGEEMGPLAWIGGGVIVTASIAAAVSDGYSSRGSSSNKAVDCEQWEGR